MKKHLVICLCCIAFVISGMAQPENKKNAEKFINKTNLEKLRFKNHLKNENSCFSQQFFSPSQKQHSAKTDWWEPDTIYGYYLDGTVERHTFSYKNGNCTVQLTQIKLDNQWTNAYQALYNYDAQNNNIEELAQVWESGQWQNSFKTIFTFDSQNNKTSSISQYWKSGQWINGWKGIYVYDSQNNVIEETGQSWDSGIWMNEEKYLYSYNDQNNWTEILYQYYEDNQWINSGKETFTYNAQNNWSEILSQYYEDGEWINEELEVFTYNEQNQCIYYIFQEWSWDFNQWVNEDKVSLTYDAQDNIISEIWQYWEQNKWINLDKSTWFYDENHNTTSGNYQSWEANAWVDADGWLSINYNHLQSEASSGGYRFTATYIDPTLVGIKENELLKQVVKTYPNPVSDVLYIENHSNTIPEVKIYSIQGALLINAKGTQIDVSSLPKGVYVAEINGISRKIVKQ